MVQKFIVKENNPVLLLFFAGWACDETPFKQYRPKNMDFMICYDYRNEDFDNSFIEDYHTVHVIGWSMGVWEAARMCERYIPIRGLRIAFNGTIHPIDNERGIPKIIFEETLHTLTPATLQKFMRRICGGLTNYKAFMEITPKRPFEEVKEELLCLKKRYNAAGEDDLADWNYHYALLGCQDSIFPLKNQENAYHMPTFVRYCNCSHYEEKVFKFLFENMWNYPEFEFDMFWQN